MKTVRFSMLMLLSLGTLAFLSDIYAQDSPQWHLSKGAKMWLGKGWITDIRKRLK